jgi:hypothetical protein
MARFQGGQDLMKTIHLEILIRDSRRHRQDIIAPMKKNTPEKMSEVDDL